VRRHAAVDDRRRRNLCRPAVRESGEHRLGPVLHHVRRDGVARRERTNAITAEPAEPDGRGLLRQAVLEPLRCARSRALGRDDAERRFLIGAFLTPKQQHTKRTRTRMFRKALFWIHLACGVVTGLVILMMSITGVVLTYERQMIAWA